jgi:hypothetical protein
VLCTGLARKRSGNVVGNGRLISKQQLSFAGDGAMHACIMHGPKRRGVARCLVLFLCNSKDSNAQCI